MANQYVAQFLEAAKDRFSQDSLAMPMAEWITRNTTLKKRPFSFRNYEFQKDIVNDMHPNMDVIKISQVGMTEVQIRKALGFLVRNNGTSLIFSLPSEDMYTRVSSTRVKPIISVDRVFNSPMDKEAKVTRSMGIMQFGQSFLYLVAADEKAATSIPADAVFNDEVDLSDQKMLTLFNSRMQNSNYKISQRFSTPTFPAFGIDLNYQTSDQHTYMTRCTCGHWNDPEFDHRFLHIPGLPTDRKLIEITKEEFGETLDFSNAYVKCEKCHQPLDLGNPDAQKWVAKYPSRVNSRGYRITPFVTDRLSLQYIFGQLWDYQKTEFLRGFHNTVLGLPYSDGNMQIPIEDIYACMTGNSAQITPLPHENIWVGVDMGQICHVTLGRGNTPDGLEIIAAYQVHVKDIVNHCKELCETMNVKGGCVDRHPYEPTSREIFEATKGIIIPIEYRGAKDMNLVNDAFGEFSHGQVNHTWQLDQFASKVRKRQIKISGYGNQKTVFAEHLRQMVRNEEPGKPAQWVKLSGEDHYFHSSAFMTVAMEFKDLIRAREQVEVRTTTFLGVIQPRDATSNLVGMSNKRVDRNLTNI